MEGEGWQRKGEGGKSWGLVQCRKLCTDVCLNTILLFWLTLNPFKVA